MKKYLLTLSIIAAMLTFTACESDDDPQKQEQGNGNQDGNGDGDGDGNGDGDGGEEQSAVLKHGSLDVTAYETWVYFSFDKGEVTEPANYAEDLSWDIAFHRWDIRTNGGESGSGQGGAYITDIKSLNNWSHTIDESKLEQDIIMDLQMENPMVTGTMDNTVEEPANPVLTGWVNVMMAMPPSYEMNETVYVVRGADGRYAALLFTDFTNDKGDKGYSKFSYLYPIK